MLNVTEMNKIDYANSDENINNSRTDGKYTIGVYGTLVIKSYKPSAESLENLSAECLLIEEKSQAKKKSVSKIRKFSTFVLHPKRETKKIIFGRRWLC